MKLILSISLALLLSSCGGGSGANQASSPSPNPTTQPSQTTKEKPTSFNFTSLTADSINKKSFTFEWTPAKSSSPVTYTVCHKDLSKSDNCLPLAITTETTAEIPALTVLKPGDFFIRATNRFGSNFSNEKNISNKQLLNVVNYIKASNSDAEDLFGISVSLSEDGNTMAIGASNEASESSGINGDQTNNDGRKVGAVYVFVRKNNNWTQQAYLKPSSPISTYRFGISVSLSDDGNSLAVGAASPETHIFTRTGITWSEDAIINASNRNFDDRFGAIVELSGDGNTLAVSADGEDSSSVGINSDQNSEDSVESGAVYIFSRDGKQWPQQAYIKASNTSEYAKFGSQIALNGDGNTLAVGAIDDSNATGINGDQNNSLADNSGAVYVFTRLGKNWSQQAYIKSPSINENGYFGIHGLSLSKDGNTLATSNIVHINNKNITKNTYIFQQTNSKWMQTGCIDCNKISKMLTRNIIALSSDGHLLATSDGYILKTFRDDHGSWQKEKEMSLNLDKTSHILNTISLSGDGHTLAIGDATDSSDAKGINGDRKNSNANNSGAVFVL